MKWMPKWGAILGGWLPGLLVQQALAAPTMNVARTGADEITVTWDGSGRLERAPSPTGPWQTVAGAVSGWKTRVDDAAAFFRLRSMFPLEVIVTGGGTGRVTSEPAGIDCGETCRAWFDEGQVVTLTAVADPASRFAGWGDGDAQPRSVRMDQPQSVTATFEQVTAQVISNPDFEEGPGKGWVEVPASPLIFRAASLGVPAASGEYVARLGYEQDNRHEAILGQVITLPSTTPLYLHFSLWVHSEELCDVPYYDLVGMYVNGETVDENAQLCHSDTTDAWERVTYDISPLAGQQIELAFRIFSNWGDPLASYVLLDAFEVNDSPL